MNPPRIELTALPGIPIIQPGDDSPGIILHAADEAGLAFQSDDVLVVAQKIISKAEGRLVDLQTVTPSRAAEELAIASRKDPRIVELILCESTEVLRVRPDLIVVEHRGGFVCANAGIDQSNAAAPHGSTSQGPWALLLPEDSDRSAQRLRDALRTATGADIAVIISDSHGRAWRLGTVGVAIGVAGLHPLSDLRGRPDLTGRALQITEVGTADELAAAAGLLMGQAAEGTPAVLVRGATFIAGEGHLREMLRAKEKDLFR